LNPHKLTANLECPKTSHQDEAHADGSVSCSGKLASPDTAVRFSFSIDIVTNNCPELINSQSFVVKCGGTGWCETNILRSLKRKCGGHDILYPHCLKIWGDVSPVPPPNCAHASIAEVMLSRPRSVRPSLVSNFGNETESSRIRQYRGLNIRERHSRLEIFSLHSCLHLQSLRNVFELFVCFSNDLVLQVTPHLKIVLYSMYLQDNRISVRYKCNCQISRLPFTV